MRALLAQTKMELLLTLRRGESVLLTFLIPVMLLVFFSEVDVLPHETGAHTAAGVDFLFPGILALAIMSTAMVSLAIATGFERSTGVLKRLGSTPLSRPQLLGAKTIAMLVIEALQLVILAVVALILGFSFSADCIGLALGAAALATIGFAGIGLLMAGSLPALTTLAAANGLYIVLLLLGGMIFPLSKLPGALRTFADGLPAGALSDAMHSTLYLHQAPATHVWVVLAAWAVAAPALAAALFRWE